jgi:hypothetical protein
VIRAESATPRRIRASAGYDRSTTSFRASRSAPSWTRSRRRRRPTHVTSGSR